MRTWLCVGMFFCAVTTSSAGDTPTKIEFRRAEVKAFDTLTETKVPATNKMIYLYKTTDLTNDDIGSTSIMKGDAGYSISLSFTEEGRKKADLLSRTHDGKPLAILIDGKVVAAPIIKDRFEAKVLITGQFTREEAERIVKGFRSE